MKPDTRANVGGNVAKMLMVSEIDDLSYVGYVGEDTGSLSRAKIIRGLENVIGDEGDRAVLVDELQTASYAQGEIELETSTPFYICEAIFAPPLVLMLSSTSPLSVNWDSNWVSKACPNLEDEDRAVPVPVPAHRSTAAIGQELQCRSQDGPTVPAPDVT